MKRWRAAGFFAVLVFLIVGGLLVFQTSHPVVPPRPTDTVVGKEMPAGERSPTSAGAPNRLSNPAGTGTVSTRYRLFSHEYPVLGHREGAINAAGEFERIWLLDGGSEMGPLRVTERIRRTPPAGPETLLHREAFVAGEIIVTPRIGVSPVVLASVLQAAGAVSWHPLPGSPHWVAQFPEPDLDTLPQALAEVRRHPEVVQAVEGNGVGRGGAVPNDPQFQNQFALQNTGQFAGLPGADIRMRAAWERVSTSSAVIVAVLDSGLEFNHPDLTDNAFLDTVEIAGNGVDDDRNGFVDDTRGWDFVNNDNDPTDDHNHGTHVAGIIGARGNNGIGISGVTWSVRLLPVKVLNSTNAGLTTHTIAGVHYARSKGARVMNLSLIDYPFSSAMADAVQAAANDGILMVISAGNSGTNNDLSPNYPSSYPNSNVIAVANTTNGDVLSTITIPSNFGATRVHLAAPGSNIVSTVRVAAGSYSYFYGTSMAAPHVTGVAALLLALRPSATVPELKGWLLDSADRLPTLAGKCVSGGRLNAAAALQLAGELPTLIARPQSQTALTGESVTFSVTAGGAAPLTYQWFRNEVAIPGATGSNYTIANVQLAQAGAYKVTVSNPIGSATSAAVTLDVHTSPVIASQPQGQAVNAGHSATFAVTVTGSPAPTFQWRFNGEPILGATNSSYTIPLVSGLHAGAYTVTVSNVLGTVTSTPATLAVVSTPPGRIINLSVLTTLDGTEPSFFVGYVVGGAGTTGAKPLVIRAAGPSLRAVGVVDPLLDPQFELFSRTTMIAGNDNWGGNGSLIDAQAAVGAFPYSSPTSRDAAIMANISNGDNSVRVSSVDSGYGAVLAEVYDATPGGTHTSTTPRLINVSVLKHLGSGLTAGFVIGGGTNRTVLLRAVGPSLAAFGVDGFVADPRLTLYGADGVEMNGNDDWGGAPALSAAFAAVGAFSLPPDSKDAALRVTLSPGSYTVEVKGATTTTGRGLVEIYEIP